MNALEQLPFFKMCGSGNDFVFFDGRALDIVSLLDASAIQALCARATGIGADGVVVLEPGDAAANVRIHYFNSDGSRASLCGNATLCAARLAAELGAVDPRRFTIATDAGVLPARIRRDGVPEIEFRPVTDVRPSAGIAAESVEGRIGFALAGVPHLVVEVDAVDSVDLDRRGRALRFDAVSKLART